MPAFLIDLAIGVVIGTGILASATWLVSGRLVRRVPPSPRQLPDKHGLPFEYVQFKSRDGIELGGWIVSKQGRLHASGGQRHVIVFCSGMFGSIDRDVDLVRPFIDTGFDVLQFDWRAHGLSDGLRGSLGVKEIEDLRGAIDFLQSMGVRQIGLLGFSMGGAVALRLAAEDTRIGCVVADSALVSAESAIAGEMAGRAWPLTAALFRPIAWLIARLVELRTGVRLAQANPCPAAGRISPRPVLLIYGERDSLVPTGEIELLYNQCGKPRALWRVSGAGHRQACRMASDEYFGRVTRFFEESMRTVNAEL